MRIWAEVFAEKEDGTVLNREQFNLLDGHRRTQFATVAAAHNGQQPGDWDTRLLQAIPVVQEKLAAGSRVLPRQRLSLHGHFLLPSSPEFFRRLSPPAPKPCPVQRIFSPSRC